ARRRRGGHADLYECDRRARQRARPVPGPGHDPLPRNDEVALERADQRPDRGRDGEVHRREGRAPDRPGGPQVGQHLPLQRPRHGRSRRLTSAALVDRLAAARIGSTFNFYSDGHRAALLRGRLTRYLEERAAASILLVGEAPGYRGTRVSGIALTSERQLTGA